MSDGNSRVERFLAHLDRLSGGVEPGFWAVEPTRPGLGRVTGIGYRDLPEPGSVLGITYGLSLAEHEAWRHGRPELCICVNSGDTAWVLAAAELAEHLRGECPFSYGDTVNVGEPLVPGTSMDGFVVFAPSVVDPQDARIEVGDDHPIHLVQVYPTYASERDFVHEQGLEAFWHLDWDPYDVTRPPVV